jgi:hypothetical protein
MNYSGSLRIRQACQRTLVHAKSVSLYHFREHFDANSWRVLSGEQIERSSVMRQILGFAFVLTLFAAVLSGDAAMAACTVPYTLTNGTTADATQVMANINSVASCVNGAPAGSTEAVQFNAGSGAFGGVGPLTNGQLVIGSTGAGPQAATLTAGTGITITNAAGAITISATGSGGVAPTVRGTGMQASTAASFTVSWPSGTVAGDLALIFVGGDWNIASTPTGWNLVDSQSGSEWNGSVIGKVLTSTDISTGSVTVTLPYSSDAAVAIITFVGQTTSALYQASQRSSSGASAASLTGNGTQQESTDYMVYFGSNRALSTDTVSLGTQLQQMNNGASGSGVLAGGLVGTSGGPFAVTPTFSFSSAGGGYYVAMISVRGP